MPLQLLSYHHPCCAGTTWTSPGTWPSPSRWSKRKVSETVKTTFIQYDYKEELPKQLDLVVVSGRCRRRRRHGLSISRMAFWKPGSKKPEASLPLSAEVDREGPGTRGRLVIFNSNENLALQAQRERLPIFKTRDAILHLVETRATTVLVGQTGCGKTTQVPQYLVEAGWTAGGRLVACTQPRRVAAMTVASRVADEMGVTLGAEVGYAVRFENVSTPGVTRVRFCTDGVLLRELMEDPLLSRYSVVMVDEAHERSLATDLLLGLLKKVQRRRPDLRIIIASATIQAEEFAAFFDTRHLAPKPASEASSVNAPLESPGSSPWRAGRTPC